ncbi:hypothetical protein [Halorussus lipolyticus]|uniref:hypothetical protein n=1 Tax=Halorussus lipolyticus TaxID=3034024 RepID=UPI0023E8CBC5|nr:hypothetical protein [Halorussus sp. DT80]
MTDAPGGASRPGVSENADGGLDGPKESIFEVLKPALVLVGMLVVFFLLLYFLG